MAKIKKIETSVVLTPTETQPVDNGYNRESHSVTYVVVRDGHRVSDREYQTLDDPWAIHEQEFWALITKNHSYGERVDIVQYDSKKHRIW